MCSTSQSRTMCLSTWNRVSTSTLSSTTSFSYSFTICTANSKIQSLHSQVGTPQIRSCSKMRAERLIMRPRPRIRRQSPYQISNIARTRRPTPWVSSTRLTVLTSPLQWSLLKSSTSMEQEVVRQQQPKLLARLMRRSRPSRQLPSHRKCSSITASTSSRIIINSTR